MKKILLILFLIVTCCVNSFAYDACIDGIYYIFNSEAKTAFVTSGNDEYRGSIVIPDAVTYNGVEYKVNSIEESAFRCNPYLTSIDIPNSVTSIMEYAFQDCTGLISIKFGNSVTSIGFCAFERCTSLTSITIPNSVTSDLY